MTAGIASSVERLAYRRNSIFSFIFAVLFFALLSFLFPASASAQTNPPSAFSPQSSATSQTTIPYTLDAIPYTSPQSPHFASQAIYNFSHAMSCILIGQSPMAPCLEYKMVKDATGMVKSVPYLSTTNTSNGVLGMSLSMIGEVISTPPIHSSLFLANLGEQIGIKSANAQVPGSGSGVLAPIFKLWEVSRNISYLVMILIFVGVGLMVMFRQKLNPQTVVSVQLALPGLVIGLVMITFSYFVASLISDIAFVGTNVVGYYFSLAQGKVDNPVQLPLMSTKGSGFATALLPLQPAEANVINIFAKFSAIVQSEHISPVLSLIWDDLDDPAKNWCCNPFDVKIDPRGALELITAFITFQMFSPLNSLFPGWGLVAAGTLGTANSLNSINTISMLLGFIAAIVLIYSMFKLLLRLIQNLLSIIFLTIAAPFYFLATALPGKQSLLPNWFFNMLCNVLAFPAVFGVFYFVAFILGGANSDPLFKITAGTTLTGSTTFPLLGGLTSDFLNRLLAFGALVALPSIPDIICRAIGKPGQLGALAAGAVGGAIAAGQRYQGQAAGVLPGLAQNTGRVFGARGMIYDPTKVEQAHLDNPGGHPWAIGGTVGQPRGWRDTIGLDERSRLDQPGQKDKAVAGIRRIGSGVNRFLGQFSSPTAPPPPPTIPPTTGGAGPGGRVNSRTNPGP